MKMYKLTEFAKRINSKSRTLIHWDNIGILKANRTQTGRRYYTEEQALKYLGISPEVFSTKIILYCRVSTKGQKDDLRNQVQYLKNYCQTNGFAYDDIIEDFGSGLNYNRKGFNEILKQVENNNVKEIIITHKDRLIRFGFEWFKSFCLAHNCKIQVLDNTIKDVHSELVEDLISIVHVFSCKLYGLRNYKRKTKLDKLVEKAVLNEDTNSL